MNTLVAALTPHQLKLIDELIVARIRHNDLLHSGHIYELIQSQQNVIDSIKDRLKTEV